MLILALALTVELQVTPAAPFTTIEATCSGGIAGKTRTVMLAADGRMRQSRDWRGALQPAGRMTPAEAKRLSERLDAAGFDTLLAMPRGRPVPDGVSCRLKREGRRTHILQFNTGEGKPSAAMAPRYQEARAVMSAILAAADRVALNPQPIPPRE